MLLIFVPKITPRIRYTFKTILKTYLQYGDYKLTTDQASFLTHKGAKFSYTNRALADELHFSAVGLLSQVGINEQSISIGTFKETPIAFLTKNEVSLPYDPFSATFYFLSRYEEYLPHLRDQYDRFTTKESLAKQKGFLQLAVVDRWIIQIREVLEHHFKALRFPKRNFKYIPTIDIDNAFAYKHKGVLRSLGSLLKTITKLDFKTLVFQSQVLLGMKKDPFDTYNYQLNIQKQHGIKSLYFILLGDYGLNDKNLSYENKAFQSLIKSISDYATLGIHPSFGSNKQKDKLKVEVDRLQTIIKREVKRSRQHFLKLSLPETYRNLLEVDIEEDYTMGFASELGFRAGTCTPYPFYDLDGEVECKLMVFPFQVMEATLKYYLKYSIEESIQHIEQIIDEVKAVDGTFISLWHNESLSDQGEWEGWRKVYENMIAYALK